jgi:hypothetical protein
VIEQNLKEVYLLKRMKEDQARAAQRGSMSFDQLLACNYTPLDIDDQTIGSLRFLWKFEFLTISSIFKSLCCKKVGRRKLHKGSEGNHHRVKLRKLHSILNFFGGISLEYGRCLGDSIFIYTGILNQALLHNLDTIDWEV